MKGLKGMTKEEFESKYNLKIEDLTFIDPEHYLLELVKWYASPKDAMEATVQ